MQAMSVLSSKRTATGGFTLLELLVVIAIMAALSAAFPLALNRFVPARRADAAARELFADVRLAQARSVTVNRPVEIVPVPNGYEVRTLEDAGAQTVSTRRWRNTTGLSLHSLDDSHELAACRVFPDGSSTGARFAIRDGERLRTVTVSELTGRVRLAKDEPQAKKL
jgi:general secretion pathway protein H